MSAESHPLLADAETALRRASEDTARRIEASVAATLGDAVSTLRGDIAAQAGGGEHFAMLQARLDALEAAGPEIARSITEIMNARLDAVDDHLADLTRTLTQHPAWDLETGFQQLHADIGALAETASQNAIHQISADAMRQIVSDAMRDMPQPARLDIEATVTLPVLTAIEEAVGRFIAASPQHHADSPVSMPPVSDLSLAHVMRDELAAAQAGHSQDIRKMETRLGALQDSVAALTEQLRAAREATERADLLAHANAMAVAGPRNDVSAASLQVAAAHTESHGAYAPPEPAVAPVRQTSTGQTSPVQTSPVPASPALASPSDAPSPAAIKSRLIAAARRANAAPRQPRRDVRTASGGAGAPGRVNKTMLRWLRGKGLLWAAAVVIGAGAMPLLAPALRALPDAILPPAGEAARLPAERAPEKIGSHLTASAHPASIVDDPAALYALGDRIAEGAAVGSPKLAASLLEKAAERGQAPAQYRIARLYEKGAGVPKDARRARAWYARAADQGNVRAMHNLAVMYADGSLGSTDYKAAASWFRKAAERGLADSQYNLGVLLARGLAGETNPTEAWTWFDIGARSGDQEAAARRNEVAAGLAPDALQSARTAAAAWRPAPINTQANDPPPTTAKTGSTAGAEPAKGERPV
ncbi:tetratricopeptide repeat protein [Camelimonas sp. ID_303_24]